MTRHKRHRSKLRSLYQWHRYLGLAVALLAVLLAITGVMLNHTERLKLDQRQINQRWLLDWYGITPPEGQFYPVSKYWLSQWGEHLYINHRELPFTHTAKLVGAVPLEDMIIAADTDSILLITVKGQLIERRDTLDGVPANIQAIAVDNGQIVLQTKDDLVRGDLQSGEWREATKIATTWSKPSTPPKTLKTQLLKQYPGPTLPMERIILDLHSGRLFGSWGSYIMDTAAVLLLFNAASGVIIWWRRRCQQKEQAKRS